MWTALAIIGVIFFVCIAVLAVVYVAMPGVFVGLMQNLMRAQSGLKKKRITVDGITWPYLEGGPRGAETIVLVHGFGANKDHWTQYAAHLTKDYHVISPDLPGFGESTDDPALSYHTQKQADRLRKFLKALGVESFHIAGNSMGGMIALRYVFSYPEDLLSLTLYNNAGVVGTQQSEMEIAYEKGENPLAITSVEDVDRFMKFIAHVPVSLPTVFKKQLFKDAKAREVLHNKILFEELGAEALESPFVDRFGEIKTPTLVIWGRYDRVLNVTCADVLSEAIPGCECAIMEDTGHVPMIERPAESAGLHRDFMRRATA